MENIAVRKLPMTREAFLARMAESREQLQKVNRDPLRLNYHVQPPMGWLNDPNGLCQKDGVYHIYHQYVPFYPELCSVFWGHMTTKDFIHYEVHEPGVYPDCAWDENGVYSGSVFIKDGLMYAYYTGNVRHKDGDYDYITAGREQNTVLMTSEDGFHFSKKELLMTNEDYPADLSQHVRDPQVFSEKGKYFMIQGARDLNGVGSVLLFESDDLKNWTYRLRFTTKEPFGYMWECPNYLKVDGHKFLIACPQGIKPRGVDLASANQCGYFPLDYDFEGTEYELGAFRQLDRGFDFYAPQVFKDESGRWILFGWMATPDEAYDNEKTLQNGWVHCMTVPRELYVNGAGRLCQRPVEELRGLRKECRKEAFSGSFQKEVDPCFELNVKLNTPEKAFSLRLREAAVLRFENGLLTLDMTSCGSGRTARSVKLSQVQSLQILSDTSSLEIFVNGGEEVFTTRIYDSIEDLQVQMDSEGAEGVMELYLL